MLGRRHEIARLQSDFYRDQFRKMLKWLIGMVFLMFILIAAIAYLILFQPQQRYYANTVEGKILSITILKG